MDGWREGGMDGGRKGGMDGFMEGKASPLSHSGGVKKECSFGQGGGVGGKRGIKRDEERSRELWYRLRERQLNDGGRCKNRKKEGSVCEKTHT